ncbi:hypothetical protein EYM_06460 [Ignicoccus islandicus DSM 13165]|uniref:MarR family transcriptional regulator n=1 Tax=Ignicoccus islandicus DSM 13165 TaxID=940295 RepID=A0A0U3FQT8_9CREN|nr:hypothetical protein [Ignicoccus islandicus]ALU12687.1 hypothetical protein EYM_06460 [Ignicoccus islandicus DSM 13165]
MVFQVTPLELLILILSDRGYSIEEISKILEIDKEMMNDLIEDLTEKGYVRLKKKRKLLGSETYLEVTEEGKRLLEEIRKVLWNVLKSVEGMVEKGNYDGAKTFVSRYSEYLPYAPLLGVSSKDFVDKLMSRLGIIPTYAPPEHVYEALASSEEWWEEF